MKNKRFRILNADLRVMYAGGDSWKTLEECRQLVDYSKGEKIFEYSECYQYRLWEIL